MLSDQEMQTILIGTNMQAMIGAGLQGRLDNQVDISLLERATELSATNLALPMSPALAEPEVREVVSALARSAQNIASA